nr:toll/interleukin-1 receptor domain-containing protein [Clostridia bacterium]
MTKLDLIKPCDTEKSYILVSYSSADSELVWDDVLEFQKRGYNIWLDDRNIDKTKASWKDDAIKAIEDYCCELVLLYVSASSLTSENCYNELKATTSERTIAYHGEAVKYIAVEAEPIDDIVLYGNSVRTSVQQSKLSKEEKLAKLETLHCFIRDFFNTNNEKVRVHAKNEPSRKMDYYNDIIAAFPDSSRVDDTLDIDNTPSCGESEVSEVDQIMAEAHRLACEVLNSLPDEDTADEADGRYTPGYTALRKLNKFVSSDEMPEEPETVDLTESIPDDILLRMTESVEDEVNGFWVRNNTFDDNRILYDLFDDDFYFNVDINDSPYAFLAIRGFFDRFDKQNDKYMLEYEPFLKGIFLTDKNIYPKDLSWEPDDKIPITGLIGVNKMGRNGLDLLYSGKTNGVRPMSVRMPAMQR